MVWRLVLKNRQLVFIKEVLKMPKKVQDDKVSILIPRDPQNTEIDAIRFQQNGVDVYVPVDKTTLVPRWVRDSAIQSGYIKE
jgi:hypothetical protein